MINLFPYTDAHELNLDWVVEQVKANNTKVKDLTHTVENMHFDFDSKADKANTYTKSEVDTLLSGKVDNATLANYYDKSETYSENEVDDLISNIRQLPDSATATPGDVLTHTISGDYWYPLDAYTKTEADNLLSAKADISSLAEVATTGDYNDLLNKPAFTEILNQKNIPATATSYTCDWSGYQFLMICSLNFYNIMQELSVPTSFIAATSAGVTVQFKDMQTNSTYIIYKDGNDHLYISSTNQNANLGIRIYGYKQKGV